MTRNVIYSMRPQLSLVDVIPNNVTSSRAEISQQLSIIRVRLPKVNRHTKPNPTKIKSDNNMDVPGVWIKSDDTE